MPSPRATVRESTRTTLRLFQQSSIDIDHAMPADELNLSYDDPWLQRLVLSDGSLNHAFVEDLSCLISTSNASRWKNDAVDCFIHESADGQPLEYSKESLLAGILYQVGLDFGRDTEAPPSECQVPGATQPEPLAPTRWLVRLYNEEGSINTNCLEMLGQLTNSPQWKREAISCLSRFVDRRGSEADRVVAISQVFKNLRVAMMQDFGYSDPMYLLEEAAWRESRAKLASFKSSRSKIAPNSRA